MDRCNGGKCWSGCVTHRRYWEGIRRRLDAEGLQCVVDDLGVALEGMQEVWDKGWPVKADDLAEAWELVGEIGTLLEKLEQR